MNVAFSLRRRNGTLIPAHAVIFVVFDHFFLLFPAPFLLPAKGLHHAFAHICHAGDVQKTNITGRLARGGI
jgi:hypothetical protein